MIEKANLAGKPFIVQSDFKDVTENEDSSSIMKCAEMSYVSNSVLDGADYIMLSDKLIES